MICTSTTWSLPHQPDSQTYIITLQVTTKLGSWKQQAERPRDRSHSRGKHFSACNRPNSGIESIIQRPYITIMRRCEELVINFFKKRFIHIKMWFLITIFRLFLQDQFSVEALYNYDLNHTANRFYISFAYINGSLFI